MPLASLGCEVRSLARTRRLVAIDGRSGAGKSRFASALIPFCGDVALVRVDEASRDIRLRRRLERDGEDMRGHWQDWMAREDEFFASDRARSRAAYIVEGTRTSLMPTSPRSWRPER